MHLAPLCGANRVIGAIGGTACDLAANKGLCLPSLDLDLMTFPQIRVTSQEMPRCFPLA